MSILTDKLKELTVLFSKKIDKLSFSVPVSYVYNPLDYAREGFFKYLDIASKDKKKVIFLGMNPGPFGMAQTGVPFGEINFVKDWLNIKADIGKPLKEHPKRLIKGLDCKRSEVSGRRLWGFFKEKYLITEVFFKDNYIANYCPLVFMEESGRNRTPDKIKKNERDELYAICDKHLVDVINLLEPEWLIGIGGFAEKRLKKIFDKTNFKIGKILHPSPASPMANRGWAEMAKEQLVELGLY